MRLIQLFILSLAVWTNVMVYAAQEPKSPASDPIAASLADGTISAADAAVYRAVKILEPESLPAQYRSSESTLSKCATDDLVEAFNIILDNPDEYQQYAKMFMARPATQWYIETPLGYFRLHFDTSGPNSIPLADDDSSGVPDYIERAANFADSCWLYEVVTLGHYPPVSDGAQGGSDQYDIYFQQVPYYGFTSPETAGPAAWNDFSSHIVVHNTFTGGFPPNDDPEGLVLGALKVTIAHEFYHAIQFAYDVSEESYFMEQSSTWMEEMAYPQVNDNYNYLTYFYTTVQTGLQAGGAHRYGAFVWPKFLQERFGVLIMREIWSRCRTVATVNAWGSAIDSAGSSLEREFARFTNWNYHTDTRYAGTGFQSGADYLPVNLMVHHYTLPDSGNFSTQPPEPYASNYIVAENLNGYNGMLVFDFSGLSATTWGISYVIDYGGGVYADSVISPVPDGKIKICVPNFENALSVTFIPGVGSHFGTNFNYSYHLYFRVAGDVDNDNIVSISDAVFMINWIFAGGATPNPLTAADVDCDSIRSISDAVYLINYIFNAGAPPCEL